MALRTFMIQEAICCLQEASDNLKRPPVHMLDQYNAVENIIEELKKELQKEE